MAGDADKDNEVAVTTVAAAEPALGDAEKGRICRT